MLSEKKWNLVRCLPLLSPQPLYRGPRSSVTATDPQRASGAALRGVALRERLTVPMAWLNYCLLGPIMALTE